MDGSAHTRTVAKCSGSCLQCWLCVGVHTMPWMVLPAMPTSVAQDWITDVSWHVHMLHCLMPVVVVACRSPTLWFLLVPATH